VIYLDNAATSMPKPQSVVQAVAWATAHLASAGRGSSSASTQAEALLYDLRVAAGQRFDCPPERVVLTGSATHGLNIAIRSLLGPGDRVVISCMEHNAVVRPLYALGAQVQVARAPLFDSQGLLQEFDRLLTPDTRACILTHVSNVFGWVLPLEAVAALCRERDIPLVVDGAQSAGILPLSLERLGAAFLAMPGHKGLQGPQGTGLLLCNHPTTPIVFGGTGSVSRQREMPDFLPDRLEPGTHNLPGAAGLLAGLQWLDQQGDVLEWEQQRMAQLLRGLRQLPQVETFTGKDQAGVVSLRVRGWDAVVLGETLADQGFALRAGLHCAPLAHDTAGTLETGTLRVSFGPRNTPQDVEAFLEALKGLLQG
jgi:selenocysteine lyase/cysteine desulfurase